MTKTGKFHALLLILLSISWGAHAQVNIEKSVVKIVNQYNRFSAYTPWNSGSTGKGTGSGFVISKNRIMTNAHVVSDTAMLLVYFHNDPKPYPAHVESIGHACDLAILKLEDETRMANVPALEFDGLPNLRSRVVTYGYPSGGQLISSTVGVVSRIETKTYVHAGTGQYLAVQTDAAINPGNSGGPVIQNGKVVGVAFQGVSKLENTGFFIPTLVTDHFLSDLTDGQYHGFPYLGLLAANLENPAARAHAGMTKDETGIRVENTFRGSSLEGHLQQNDIITAIDGYDVANDGTINWKGHRLNCKFLSELKQVNQKLLFTVIRNNERIEFAVVLNDYDPHPAKAHLYDKKPSYYIYAGLVFTPLNMEILESYSSKWMIKAPQELIYETYYRPLIEHDFMDTRHVVQIRRLDHAVNAEETKFIFHIVESVNGKRIHTLKDLVPAFKDNEADQHVIQFKYGNRTTVLDRQQCDAAHDDILKQYAIPKDRRL